jgi:hypothetical protein
MKSNGFHPGSLLIQRKFINASVVSLGFSSSTQWPVFEDNDCGVRGDIFDLPPKDFSIYLFAANRQRRHGQPGLRELREILRRLLKRNEIGPAGG